MQAEWRTKKFSYFLFQRHKESANRANEHFNEYTIVIYFFYTLLILRAREGVGLCLASQKHASEITRNYCRICSQILLKSRANSTGITHKFSKNHAQFRSKSRTNPEEITRDFSSDFSGFWRMFIINWLVSTYNVVGVITPVALLQLLWHRKLCLIFATWSQTN